MPQVVVTGTPQRKLGPVNRNAANVEAEQGETVLTNMSKGLNNLVELYTIGGNKHSKGGTPLNLPAGSEEGDGSSFIFSNSKKMMVKDPNLLEYFGMNPKKPVTFADISKKFIPAINLSKETLMDKNLDSISKRSATLSMDKAVFYLNSLKLLQESMKGFKDGVPSNLDPFFDKTKIKPEELFAVTPQDEQSVTQNAMMAYGGMVRKKLPMFSDGGAVWNKDNPDPQAQYNYIVSLKDNADFKKALWIEYQKIKKDPNQYGSGYQKLLNTDNFSKFEIKNADELYDAYRKMQERNLVLKSHGVSNYGQTSPIKGQVSNAEVSALTKKYNVPLGSMDEAVKEQIAFRAFNNIAANQTSKEYAPLLGDVLKPFSALTPGPGDDRYAGSQLSRADGAYTNDTAQEVSLFDPTKIPQIKVDESKPGVTVDPGKETPDDPYTAKGLSPERGLVNPYGFRQEDMRSLGRAIGSRFSIKSLQPWMATPNLTLVNSAYYSPERAIAAIQEQTKQSKDMLTAFGTPQSATANAMAISGQAYGQIADVIGNYADRNVGIFNQTEQFNTQLANAREEKNAANATNMHDKRVILEQNLTNAVNAAKDKIVQLSNAATKNAADIYNMNLMTENFKQDPLTGIVYKANDRDILPTAPSNKEFGEEFNQFSKTMPGVSPDLAMKAFLAVKSGKYQVDDDNMLTPNELTRNNQ